jgi:hypothetical protein
MESEYPRARELWGQVWMYLREVAFWLAAESPFLMDVMYRLAVELAYPTDVVCWWAAESPYPMAEGYS